MSHEEIFRARVLASRYEQLKALLQTSAAGACLAAAVVWANFF